MADCKKSEKAYFRTLCPLIVDSRRPVAPCFSQLPGMALVYIKGFTWFKTPSCERYHLLVRLQAD